MCAGRKTRLTLKQKYATSSTLENNKHYEEKAQFNYKARPEKSDAEVYRIHTKNFAGTNTRTTKARDRTKKERNKEV